MTELNEQAAATIVSKAIDEARRHGFRPMAVVVVDAAAQVLASLRQPAATALRLDIALGKAAAAVGMGANTRTLATRSKDMPVFFGSVAVIAEQKFCPQTGGMLILGEGGKILGAVGSSGGTGEEDEQICIAGVAAAGLTHG